MLIEIFKSMIFDYTLRNVSLGALVLGVFAGALGSFAVLRKQSLLGDAMSHAALPGIALAFLITLSKEPLVLLIGATISGLLGTLFMIGIVNSTIIKKDAALGIILSVFFGFGIVLLTYIQKLPTANQAGLKKFLFGNASTLLQSDVKIMAALGFICLIGILLFWKEFKILSFDPDFASSLGFPIAVLDVLLTSLIVIAIVIGLQTVGVVLMSAMIIAPAAAARQWTNKLGTMVLLASFFGAVAGVLGAVASSMATKIPTGPSIVVFVSFIVIISLLFAPVRGLLWEWLEIRKNKRKIDVMRLTLTMLRLSESHKDPCHAHDIPSLEAANPIGVLKTLAEMKKKNLAREIDGRWALTSNGLKEAKRLDESYGEKYEPSI